MSSTNLSLHYHIVFGTNNHEPMIQQAWRARAMTLIEIKPHRWGSKVFEALGVEPVFPEKRQAIDYAQCRAYLLIYLS